MSKDYRRDWAQAAALKKLKEMRGDGMSLEDIGASIGVSGTYIGKILRPPGSEPPSVPVSEKVWLALIKKHGLSPNPPTTERVGDVADRFTLAIETLVVVVREMNAKLDRIESRLK